MQLVFIITNQVEKMSHDIHWPMNHLISHENNYIFIYFGMPLKMGDINSFSFSSKSTLIASLNCICNHKPLCSHLCDKLFLPSATKDSHIYIHRSGWFGHKSQMHGLEWTWFLVVYWWPCLIPNIQTKHDVLFANHFGLNKSMELIFWHYWWP